MAVKWNLNTWWYLIISFLIHFINFTFLSEASRISTSHVSGIWYDQPFPPPSDILAFASLYILHLFIIAVYELDYIQLFGITALLDELGSHISFASFIWQGFYSWMVCLTLTLLGAFHHWTIVVQGRHGQEGGQKKEYEFDGNHSIKRVVGKGVMEDSDGSGKLAWWKWGGMCEVNQQRDRRRVNVREISNEG